MSDTFDWAGLAKEVSDVRYFQGKEPANDLLRTRIEAAFVPVELYEDRHAQLMHMRRMYDQATARAEAAEARNKVLEEALASEREDNLWNAYHTGYIKDGRWSHMFMHDGEWLAAQCDLDPRDVDYDDASIRAAIPIAARAALGGDHGKC